MSRAQPRAIPEVREGPWLWLFPVLLVAGLAAGYGNALRTPFVFDDLTAIPQNQTLADFLHALHPPPDTTVSGRPLVNVSFYLNRRLGGVDPRGYHWANLAIHGAAACLLFGFARRVLRRLEAPEADLVAAAAALLWAVHPLQTEAVTYVVQRAESLMGLCYLATLYAFVRAAEHAEGRRASRLGWGSLAVLACWLGMAAKEVMVSAPVLVLALDRAVYAGSWREALRRRWPLHAGMAASWILLAALVASTHGRSGTAGFEVKIDPGAFVTTQLFAILHYLRLALFPAGQVFDYGTLWETRPSHWMPAALLIAVLAAVGVRGFVRNRPWAWLIAWFFAVLAPTSLIPGVRQTMAEHRMYLALAPLLIGLCSVGGRRLGRWLALAAAAAAVVLTWTTLVRNRAYASELSIWEDTLAKRPDSAFAQNNVGAALLRLNPDAKVEGYFLAATRLDPSYQDGWGNLALDLAQRGHTAEAEREYRRAWLLGPHNPVVNNNYGNLLRNAGRLPEAYDHLSDAVDHSGYYPDARNNLGNVLIDLGRYSEAERQFRAALAQEPTNALAWNGLGTALLRQNRVPEALAAFDRSLALRSDSADTIANRAEALSRLGQAAEADRLYRRAEALAPTSANIRYNHGNFLFRQNRPDDAARAFADATRIQPGFAMAHYNRAVALFTARRMAEAAEEARQATQLAPAHAPGHNVYGVALMNLGRPAEALREFQAAAALAPDLPGIQNNIMAARRAAGSGP